MKRTSIFRRSLACAAMLATLAAAPYREDDAAIGAAQAETRPPARSLPTRQVLPRPRPEVTAPTDEQKANADDVLARRAELPREFHELAKRAGEPQIPGLTIVYLHPLGLPADATHWRNIIVHQTEGPAGSAKAMALEQAKNPTKRGVMLWMETDGTVYWATAETAITTHGDGANRSDNKYIDNSRTYRNVIKTNSIGVEFVGNYPDVAKPATRAQKQAWLVLVRFLQERYGIATE